MTLTGFWSWHGFQTPVIPYETCLKYLISCAGGDGNLLMNVGPMPTGQIDPREEDRLLKVGKWLKKNGESIYGTRGGPFMPDSSIVSTYKGNQIFLFSINPQKEEIELPGLKGSIIKAQTLSGAKIEYIQSKDQISITLPKGLQEDIVTVIKLTLDKNVDEEQIPVKKRN
jgi:alpha-L-fucosidase